MNKPKLLEQLPCMMPWVGQQYRDHRVLVLCESHYMPEGSHISVCPRVWYHAQEADLCRNEREYIDTRRCVKDRLKGAPTEDIALRTLVEGIQFHKVAFFNYFFRPARYKTGLTNRRSNGRLSDCDKKVAEEILTWFVKKCPPKLVFIASKAVCGYAPSVLCKVGIKKDQIIETRNPARGGVQKVKDAMKDLPSDIIQPSLRGR